MTRLAIRSVREARELAKARLPHAIFDYIDGGKEEALCNRRNEEAFARVLFSPKVCMGKAPIDISATILGDKLSMPLVIAPTGPVRFIHPDGEIGAAKAAAAMGIPISISTLCSTPVQEVVQANEKTWLQLYMIKGREGASYTMNLAREAGCHVLVMTLDVAAITPTDHIGPALPMSIDLKSAIGFFPEAWRRPGWLLSQLRDGLDMRAPNAPPHEDGRSMQLSEAGARLTASAPDWEDVKWVRDQWQGKLVVKGVLRVDDALKAAEIGADAISVSNHGGKVLDAAPAALSVLPEISEAVGTRIEVLLDGGVRRGADVVRARALGAKAVMIGRPYLWGLACRGGRGVSEVLSLFERGMRSTLRQIGCPSFEALNRDWIYTLSADAI